MPEKIFKHIGGHSPAICGRFSLEQIIGLQLGFSPFAIMGKAIASVSHNVTIDLRPRRRNGEGVYRKLLIYQFLNLPTRSLQIPAKNDVASYFRSAGNCINVSIFGHVRSRFLDNRSTDFENIYILERVI